LHFTYFEGTLLILGDGFRFMGTILGADQRHEQVIMWFPYNSKKQKILAA